MQLEKHSPNLSLSLAALGIVFGDIGTSPLYTLAACFDFSGASPSAPQDVMGIASLLVYALVVVVCFKYVGIIMQVDHNGEGGILALLALGSAKTPRGFPIAGGALFVTILIGAAMLLGDGSLTPAISVVSAIEGIELLSPSAAAWIVPASILILVGLFMIQSYGTDKIGRIFGPLMLIWFITLGVSGIWGIAQHPDILGALDPRHALWFLSHHGKGGFFVLGGVVLAITGVEALYADLSHFGRKPIAYAWYAAVFPSLVLCYLGECAMTLIDVRSLHYPLYSLTPGIWRIPAIILATCATIIASQALISGSFTLIQQAISLGISPRFEVRHTSASLRGQVYVPVLNFALMIGCISLVFIFRSSAALSSAFGLAVSCTMLATSIAWYCVVRKYCRMNSALATMLLIVFLIIDSSFVIAGLPKFADGGWVPFLVSAVLTVIGLVFRGGREAMALALAKGHVDIALVQAQLDNDLDENASTMVVLSSTPDGVPFFGNHAWVRNLMHNEHLVLLTLIQEQLPWVEPGQKVQLTRLGRINRIEAHFGYMEPPRIESIITACREFGLELDRPEVSYIIAEPRIRAEHPRQTWLRYIRRILFIGLARIGRPISEDLQIPPERQIEVGVTVTL